MVKIGGQIEERAERTVCSNESKVFMIMAAAFEDRASCVERKLSNESFGSVVRMTLEKCLRRRGITPGIQAIGVSRYPFVKQLSSVCVRRAEKKRSFECYKVVI